MSRLSIEMRNYPVEVYKEFEMAVSGSGKSFRHLLEGGYPEWAAFSHAIQGDRKAVIWLLKNGYPEMGVLANAILEEPGAINWLSRHDDKFYYVFFCACRGDERARAWLEERKMHVFLILAEAIRKATNFRIKKEVFWYTQDW